MRKEAADFLRVFADALVGCGEGRAAFVVRTCIPEFGENTLDITSTAADAFFIPLLRRVYGQQKVEENIRRLMAIADREFPEFGLGRLAKAAWLVKRDDPPKRAKLENLILEKIELGVFPSFNNLYGRAEGDGKETAWRRELLFALGWTPPGEMVNPLGVVANNMRWWPAENFLREWRQRHNVNFPLGIKQRVRGKSRKRRKDAGTTRAGEEVADLVGEDGDIVVDLSILDEPDDRESGSAEDVVDLGEDG